MGYISRNGLDKVIHSMYDQERPHQDKPNISQPHQINKMTQGFIKDVKSLRNFNTSATPHKGNLRNQETETNISYNLQKRYRSEVVSLLII